MAIIFSLEGVFASIFGWIILDQFLTEIKIIGIIIILSSVIFSQLAPFMVKKNMDRSKGFMKHLGGLSFTKIDNNNYEFTVKIKDVHLNTGGIAHGGYLATIADARMGTAAHMIASGKKDAVTINLEIKFLSAGKLGDDLTGKVQILKKTKTLIFINCIISNSKGIVSSASGTWKILT